MLTRRRFLPKERPDTWTLNPAAGLAQGLAFFGGGNAPGGSRMYDRDRAKGAGTLTNMDPSTDWKWSAELGRWVIDYDGADTWVIHGTDPFAGTAQFSIHEWVKSTTGGYYAGLLSNRTSWSGNGVTYYHHTTHQVKVGNTSVNSDTAPSGVWESFAATYDGNVVTLYIDGKLVASTSIGAKTLANSHLVQGQFYAIGYTSSYSGLLSDPLIHNRILTLPEIQALADPSNVMLSVGGSPLILPPRRRLWAVGSGVTPANASASLSSIGSLAATSVKPYAPFQINASTGEITVADATQLVIGDVAEVEVQVEDAASDTATATWTVTMTSGVANASVVVQGVGTLTAGSQSVRLASAVIQGVGSLTAGSQSVRLSIASLTSIGSLTATSLSVREANATVQGISSLAATGHIARLASAVVQGIGSLAADSFITYYASSNLTSVGSLTAGSLSVREASSNLTSVGSLTAGSQSIRLASANLTSIGTLTAVGDAANRSYAELSGVGQLTADSFITYYASAVVQGVGQLTAGSLSIREAIANLSSTGSLTASSHIARLASATIQGIGTLSATGFSLAAKAELTGIGQLGAVSYVDYYSYSTLQGKGQLTGVSVVAYYGVAELSSVGRLLAASVSPARASCTLTSTGSLYVRSVSTTRVHNIFGSSIFNSPVIGVTDALSG